MAVNVKKVALFLGLTYALTYLLAICYFLSGGSVRSGILIFGITYMFMPTLCAVVVQKVIYKSPLKEPLRINFRPNRWFLVAWLLPLLIAITTFGVALLFPGVIFSPGLQDDFRTTNKMRQSAPYLHFYLLDNLIALERCYHGQAAAP